jgi:hypothetical protein
MNGEVGVKSSGEVRFTELSLILPDGLGFPASPNRWRNPPALWLRLPEERPPLVFPSFAGTPNRIELLGPRASETVVRLIEPFDVVVR